MIRTLLTTTAIAVLMGTSAFAQDATPAPAPDAPAVEAPADPAAPAVDATTPAPAVPVTPSTDAVTGSDVDSGAAQTTDIHEPWDLSAGYVAADTDNLGTRLIGQPVYSSAGEEAEEIGNISDIVFSADGQITAVIIGVGGFLCIGEKAVAVDFHSLEFTLAHDNTERWVVPTTAEALSNAPDFVWAEDEPIDPALPADGMAPMAPADGMAPAPAPQ